MAKGKSNLALAAMAGATSGILFIALIQALFTERDLGLVANSSVAVVDVEDEIFVFACGLYHESDRENERKVVAWVIRNRVEKRYLGNSTYRSTISHDNQFPDFTGSQKRLLSLSFCSDIRNTPLAEASARDQIRNRSFLDALALAQDVYTAREEENPVPGALWFFSPISMRNEKGKLDSSIVPKWVKKHKPLDLPGIDPKRLLVFKDID